MMIEIISGTMIKGIIINIIILVAEPEAVRR